MKLRDLFDRIRPMFHGQASTEETARAVYGADDSVDGRRLALYNHVRHNRADELQHPFSRCAKELGDAWGEIAFAYFVRYPWGSFDYQPGGERFASYLAEVAPARGFAAWLPDLAVIEWATFRATFAPDEPDRDAGPIRVASSVALHRIGHDVARWLIHPERPPQPERRAVTVLTWKGVQGTGRFTAVDDVQLAILDQLRAGALDPDQVPAAHGVTALALGALARAGIVLGDVSEALAATTDPDLPPATTTAGSDLSRRFALAAFAQARWEDGALQLWSPVASEVIASEDPSLALVAGQLAAPRAIGDAIRALADLLPPAQVVEIADALETSGLLVPADAPPHPAVAAGWDVHEAAVHAVARAPDAATPDQVPPAIRPFDGDHARVALAPIVDRPVGDLAQILARRVETWRFARGPIPFATFAHLLGLAARNRTSGADATGVTRPYPSAADRYSLEIYPVVRAGGVDGLAAGVYRYRPESDQLEQLIADAGIAAACLSDVGHAGPDAPGVLLKITARIDRAVRGADGGSLQLVLQEVGGLIQTVALAATALELGACLVTATHDHAFAGLRLVEPWSEPVLGGVAVGMLPGQPT